MLYRIFTEYRNIDKIKRIAARNMDGFTVIPADGYWKGQEENSVIIEYVGNDTTLDRSRVQAVAEQIKKVNHQDVVLVQAIENNSWLV